MTSSLAPRVWTRQSDAAAFGGPHGRYRPSRQRFGGSLNRSSAAEYCAAVSDSSRVELSGHVPPRLPHAPS